MKVLLPQSCGGNGAGMMNKSIEHPKAGMELINREKFGKRMVTGYYSCTLMHPNMNGDKDLDRMYGRDRFL